MTQLATSVSKQEERKGKLTSQVEHPPPANVNMVVTRSGEAKAQEIEGEKNPRACQTGKEKSYKKIKEGI